MEPRLLHVANGTTTTGLIKAAGIPGIRSLWADVLYEGPVPGGISDDELLDVRREFLDGGPDVDPVNDLREWRAAIGRHESYDELVLWFEHDLFDQLNLIQVLTWIRDHAPAATRVSLISIDSFPGHADFKGMGELNPRELGSLLVKRRPVAPVQYEVARMAWEAFRRPTPEALSGIRARDTSALPFLAAALSRFLEEYPWTADGLSLTERRLLRLAEGGPIALTDVFLLMNDGEPVYSVTDGTIASLAVDLSRTSPPLLALRSSTLPAVHVLSGTIALTDDGRSLLAGGRDRVALCGIDRWLGGVHLRGRGPVWRWDPERQQVVVS